MIEKMRAELAGLYAKIERRKKIDAVLQNLQSQERTLQQREKKLKSSFSKENADVERLEKTTATSVFYAMLGKKEIRLDKERQEAAAARLKYDAAARQLDDCRMRIDQLKRERESLSGCSEQYAQVFTELQAALRSDPAYAEKFYTLERRHGEAAGQLKELEEAISAGKDVMNQIKCIEENLDSAESWGTWDVLGGGLLSDLEKHSHLDEAQADAEELQLLLGRFHAELADVRISSELGSVNIDGFMRFADYFFDGLVADLSVLSRIHESQESVLRVEQQVGEALSKLSEMRRACGLEQAAIEKEIAAAVTKA